MPNALSSDLCLALGSMLAHCPAQLPFKNGETVETVRRYAGSPRDCRSVWGTTHCRQHIGS
jgi:hypothetical protein